MAAMTVRKLCYDCFVCRFGSDAKIGTTTWSAQCSDCQKPTPRLGLLIKVEVPALGIEKMAAPPSTARPLADGMDDRRPPSS